METFKSPSKRINDTTVRILMNQAGIPCFRPLQLHIMHYIFRNGSVACIAPPKSGKTVSYLIPLLSQFIQKKQQAESDSKDETAEEEEEESGLRAPSILIVCSGHRTVENVKKNISKILEGVNYPKIIDVTSGRPHNRIVQDLINGCEILIATPRPLLRLMEDQKNYFENISLMIFDDGDKFLQLHDQEARKIVAKYYVLNRKRCKGQDEMLWQAAPILFFGEKWSKTVSNFATQILHRPTLLFGNLFEAAVHANIRCRIHWANGEGDVKDVKGQILANIVKRFNSEHKMAIACAHDDDCDRVRSILEDNGIHTLIVKSDTAHFEHMRIVGCWSSSSKYVLVCSDSALEHFVEIKTATFLVHYTLPENCRKAFNNRFHLMKEYIESEKKTQESDNLHTTIILSKNELPQANYIYHTTRRLLKTKEIPQQLKDMRTLPQIPLCLTWSQFGYCPLKNSFCFDRHAFIPSIEKPRPDLPKDGQIKFIVTYVKSASEFYFRLMGYHGIEESYRKWNQHSPNYSQIKPQLDAMINEKAGQVTSLEVGRVYGIFWQEGGRQEMRRVRIDQILEVESDLTVDDRLNKRDAYRRYVKLYHLDHGVYTKTLASHLIYLPSQELEQFPACAFRAFHCGIRPIDGEIHWDASASHKFFESVKWEKSSYCTAWIRMQVDGTFWLDSLETCKVLQTTRCQVTSKQPSHVLLENGLAELVDKPWPNDQVVPSDYIASASMKERTLAKWEKDIQNEIVSYAHIEDYSKVYVSWIEPGSSLSEIYVQLIKNYKILEDLEGEIDEQFDSLKPLRIFGEGIYCLVIYEENLSDACNFEGVHMNRAQIIRVDEEHVDIICVDYGEKKLRVPKSKCYVLPVKYMKKLPFQGIKIQLHGCQVKSNTNPQFDNDVIYDYVRDEKNEYLEILAQKISGSNGSYVARLYIPHLPHDPQCDRSNELVSLSRVLADLHSQFIDLTPEEAKEVAEHHLTFNQPQPSNGALSDVIEVEEEDYDPEHALDEAQMDEFFERSEANFVHDLGRLFFPGLGDRLRSNGISVTQNRQNESYTSTRGTRVVEDGTVEDEPDEDERDYPPIDYQPGDFDYEITDTEIAPFDPADVADEEPEEEPFGFSLDGFNDDDME